MNPRILREYKRLRSRGWGAPHSLRCARIHDQFEALASRGLVKFEVEPDPDGYDASFVDDWTDRSEKWRQLEKKRIENRAEREGTNFIVSYVMVDGGWDTADSCGGFIGNDWEDSGYDFDLKAEAISRVKKHCLEEAHPGYGEPKSQCSHPDCVVEHVMTS